MSKVANFASIAYTQVRTGSRYSVMWSGTQYFIEIIWSSLIKLDNSMRTIILKEN